MLELLLLFVINVISIICSPLTNIEIQTPTTTREFCLYTTNKVVRMVNPFYINSQNKTIYFESIEEYAKYVGPTWFGVGFCDSNKLVNNVGEYYTVTKKVDVSKRDESKKQNQSDGKDNVEDEKLNDKPNDDAVDDELDVKDDDIYKVRTLEEYKERYAKIIEKKAIKMKNISLTSSNPAYNPYHQSLINFNKNGKTNFITVLGTPYTKEQYKNLVKEDSPNYKNCMSVTNMKGSTFSCSIAYLVSEQQSITIALSNGKTYHKANGQVYSEGDAVTDDINSSVELASALSKGGSISSSESKGTTNSLEQLHSIVNSKALAIMNSNDYTHTDTREESYSHTVSEENSHSRSDGGEVIDETNWSHTDEKSNTDEYSRMRMEDYEKAKKGYKPERPEAYKNEEKKSKRDIVKRAPNKLPLSFSKSNKEKGKPDDKGNPTPNGTATKKNPLVKKQSI